MGLASLIPMPNFKKERGRDSEEPMFLLQGKLIFSKQNPKSLACTVVFTISSNNWGKTVVLELTLWEHLIMQTQKLKKPQGTHTLFSHLHYFLQAFMFLGFLMFTDALLLLLFLQLSDVWMSLGSNKETHVALWSWRKIGKNLLNRIYPRKWLCLAYSKHGVFQKMY